MFHRLVMGTCIAIGFLPWAFDRGESAWAANGAIPLIFDTDMGNDIDDALALALIHAFENRGECRLLAVTITNDHPDAAPFVDLVNTFYGRGHIPIGVVRGGVKPKDGSYLTPVLSQRDQEGRRFPRDLNDGNEAPEATQVLRKALAAAEDRSVVVLQVGFSTNLARLLESPADAISELDGKSLVARKVRLLSIMAGAFSEKLARERFREYNVIKDIPAAQKLYHNWPSPILFSGWEIGAAILYPAKSIEQDYAYGTHHPVAEGYLHYQTMPYDRPTWDLTSVLVAVRPDRNYFDLSPPGTVTVEDDGFTRFTESQDGNCRYLTVRPEQIIMVKEAFVHLCSEPPKTATP